MAEITAAAVMALRDKTGLPMMECKKALQACGGNTDEAVEWLRKQGVKTQAMRADRSIDRSITPWQNHVFHRWGVPREWGR